MIRFRQAIAAFIAVIFFAACSRPMATFQPSPPHRFYSQQAIEAAQPAVDQTDADVRQQVSALTTPVVMPGSEIKTAPIEAVASLKPAFAPEKRLTQRLERVERQLTESRLTTTAQPVAARKTSLLQQLTLKKMAKVMQRKLAPKQTKEITGNARLGLIIAGVGLVFLLIGNSLGSILGLVALLAGGALFFYSMLQQ